MRKKKIAILSHFDSFQAGYALHVGWLERARLLSYFEQEFDFLVNAGCPEGLYPNQKNILGRIKTGKPFVDRVKYFVDLYTDVLRGYDFVMTADMVYQTKGNFLAYNAAQRMASKSLRCHWLHWIHSGWTRRPKYPLDPAKRPEHLKYIMPEKSTLIYLNSHELPDLQKMFACAPHQVYPVYNPKDFRSFNQFHKLSWEISIRLRLWEKDAIMLFPFCATRMDSKGFDAVAHVVAALKRAGLRVALINAVANSRSRKKEMEDKDAFMASLGLEKNSDYMWTCDVTEKHRPLPRESIADLFKLSNFFVWASWRETVGNAFQEAQVSGNLMVLSKGLPSNIEMGAKDAIYFYTTHKTPGVQDGVTGDLRVVKYRDPDTGEDTTLDYYDGLAEQIIPRLPTRSNQWQFSYERIWYEQLFPLLYLREYDDQGNFAGLGGSLRRTYDGNL